MARSTRRQTRWSIQNPNEAKSYIPAHHPTVFTKLVPDVGGGGRPPDEVYRKWNLWHPQRERLEFRFDNDERPGTLTYERTQERTAEGMIQDIAAVPDMREICPHRSTLRCELLDIPTPENPVSHDVAAQIFVPKGKVSAGGDRQKGQGVDVHFTPLPKGRKELTKTIVPHVVVTVETELVTVFTYSLDTGEQLDPLVFRLTEDAVIRISNGDPSDMITNFQRIEDVKEDLKAAPVAPEAEDAQLFDFAQISSRFPTENAVADLSKFVAHATSSGFDDHAPLFPRAQDTSGNPITEIPDSGEPREVDLDFELFYTLLDGEDDGLSPIPRKMQGFFPERNCFTCQIGCNCVPRLKSVRE